KRGFERTHHGHEDEDAPESVHDRRNRCEQLGEERERLTHPPRRELRQKNGNPERDRRRQEQREERGVQRAPDERPRAELAGDGIPDVVHPESQPEPRDRELRLTHQLDADRDDDAHEQQRREARDESKCEIPTLQEARHHDTLMVPSASISSLTTSGGSGAYPRSGANF